MKIIKSKDALLKVRYQLFKKFLDYFKNNHWITFSSFLAREIPLTNLGFNGSEDQKKVALIYHSKQLFNNPVKVINHANTIHSTILLTALLERGYNVDVYDHKRSENISNIYDIVIGLGDQWRKIRKSKKTKKILWLVEPVPSVLKKNSETLNISNNKNKKGIYEEKKRLGLFYKNSDLIDADLIFHFGEKHEKDIKKLTKAQTKVIHPAGLMVDKNIFPEKSSKGLLWFGGSGGWRRKGLDLILLANREGNLGMIRICGINKKELPHNLRSECAKFYGTIDVMSSTFKKVIQKSRFSILLSKGEGLPISIVSTMKAGLIPIISEHCGSNFGDLAVVLKDEELNPDFIQKKIKNLQKKSVKELDLWSKNCHDYAHKEFNFYNCKNDIMNALKLVDL